jgi:hypothetical protein
MHFIAAVHEADNLLTRQHCCKHREHDDGFGKDDEEHEVQ